MNSLKHYFYGGFIFSATTLATFLTFAAWTNISTRSDGQTMSATYWNELVDNINTIGAKVDTLSNIPPGMVATFYGTSCPNGWTKADGSGDETKTDGTLGNLDLRGEFVRGLDDGKGVDSSRGLATAQSGTAIPYIYVHRVNSTAGVLVSPPVNSYPGDNIGLTPTGVDSATSVPNGQYFTTPLSPSGGFNSSYYTTHPRNVALLYCVKQ